MCSVGYMEKPVIREKKSPFRKNKPTQHSELTDVPQYREREGERGWGCKNIMLMSSATAATQCRSAARTLTYKPDEEQRRSGEITQN